MDKDGVLSIRNTVMTTPGETGHGGSPPKHRGAAGSLPHPRSYPRPGGVDPRAPVEAGASGGPGQAHPGHPALTSSPDGMPRELGPLLVLGSFNVGSAFGVSRGFILESVMVARNRSLPVSKDREIKSGAGANRKKGLISESHRMSPEWLTPTWGSSGH